MKRFLPTVALLVSVPFFSPSSFAASQDECSIWLCLPGGFPSGCGAAYSAMKDRISPPHPKSPLPPWDDCAVSGTGETLKGSEMTSDYVIAAKMRDGSLIKGTRCTRAFHRDGNSPRGCVATVRYVDVFQNGQTMGNRYYIQGGENTQMWEEPPTDMRSGG